MSVKGGLSALQKSAQAAAERLSPGSAAQRVTDNALKRLDPDGKTRSLVVFIRHTAGSNDPSERSKPTVIDPKAEVFDLATFRATFAEAGDALAWQVCVLMREGDERVENTILLVEAAAGWNRAMIERNFNQQKLAGIKAYGLLPVANERELVERTLRLQQEAKDPPRLGQQRRVAHAAVVQTALANLAQVAGYADATRLEWEVEVRLVADMLVEGRRWVIGDYTLRLVVDGADAHLTVERGGKRLKSIPSAVRLTDAYEQARFATDRLRKQASRLRSGLLEGLIASGEALTPDELRRFLRLPAARDYFQRLIWRSESGVTGLFDAATFALRDLDGRLHPLTTPISLAHAYHLFADGTLAGWQRAIVHAHIVQPIKQAFRELYVLTPAELDSVDTSARFAHHHVDAAVAKKLLSVRGWQLDNEFGVLMPYKLRDGLRAVFDFSDTLYVFSSSLPAQSGRIYFERWTPRKSERLPLEEVPPVFFSEVMRDADLVVSVAQRDGEKPVSPETYQQRGSLVRALLDDLGLPGVTVEGHFAHVQGKLARYRVHLGSAAIHIEPGNYLCIIPDRAAPKRESFYLPFADGDDPKFSEVVSKILLLHADDRIADESILRQIRRNR